MAVIKTTMDVIVSSREFTDSASRVSFCNQNLSNAVVGVAIGNFDGFHLGHARIISSLKNRIESLAAKSNKIPIVAILTFSPHPRRVFSGLSREKLICDSTYSYLYPLKRRIALAKDSGVNALVIQRFISSFFELSAEEFIAKYLKEYLSADIVAVGKDWIFGKNRTGNVALASSLQEKYNFELLIVDDVQVEGSRVSTSAIKKAILVGQLQEAKKLLNRNFDVFGRVVHGSKRGRTLGFPTANLNLISQILPPNGIYAAWAYFDDKKYKAAVNVGVRPVFESAGKRLVEAHLFSNEWLDLYGKQIRLEFMGYVRPEKKFADVSLLIQEMKQDLLAVDKILCE
jgi:riboflavin kinase / FMN adenylyltransferase